MTLRLLTLFTGLLAGLVLPQTAPLADAQAARSVLLRLCNDAPFDVGLMAAYQTGASPDRTLQGWFLVPANDCLEGGIDGVAGGQIGLHGFSGEWRWPAFHVGMEYCAPANGGRRPGASGPPCGPGEQAARFQPVTITRFRSGWGAVDHRISCSDFATEDRALCEATPRARDGMAVPVRELEVCNYDNVSGRYALAVDNAGGRFHVEGWRDIAPSTCEIVYRGFPADDRVYIRMLATQPHDEGRRATPFGNGRLICHAPSAHFDVTAPRIALIGAQTCPADAPDAARFQEIHFRPQVSRFTHTVHTLN
tara:strand:- start:2950 stop:3873 length:924 start_codon:yes stop_codon:yes gene_type:complete